MFTEIFGILRFMIALLFILLSFGAHAENLQTGYVEACHDADTCKVSVGNSSKTWTVRLAGVDAPEADQEYGDLAQIELESLVRGKTVELDCTGRSYKRYTCYMYINGQDVGDILISNGWAFELIHFSKGRYTDAQLRAKLEGRGLWGFGFAQSPVCFREKNREQCRKNPHFGIVE